MNQIDKLIVKLDTSPKKWPGLSRGRRPSEFDPTQLRIGTKIEMEHVRNRTVAQRIAMDHLVEDARYYKKLSKVHHDRNRASKACDLCGTPATRRYAVRMGRGRAARVAMVGASCAKRFPRARTSDLIRLASNMSTSMDHWNRYRRTGIVEMRPYITGEKLSNHVSISQFDLENGSPKNGDMIARDPGSHTDQWLVAKAYFEANFTPIDEPDLVRSKSPFGKYGPKGRPSGKITNWPRREPLREDVRKRKKGERPEGYPRSLPWNEIRSRLNKALARRLGGGHTYTKGARQ
jgi:hypothetical protein